MPLTPAKMAAIAAALRAWFAHTAPAPPPRRRARWNAEAKRDPMRAAASLQLRTR